MNTPSASSPAPPNTSEHELEQALLGNVRRFLIEMGGDFTFVGNQNRLVLEGQEYFIDLLLFHRELQCLVAVKLKLTEFRPEYAGKMNFYLSLLNDQVKKPHEQPSIGIIICQSKQRTLVVFALRDVNKPIGVATFTLTNTRRAAPLLPQQRRAGAPPRCCHGGLARPVARPFSPRRSLRAAYSIQLHGLTLRLSS